MYTYGQGSAAHLEIACILSLDPLLIYMFFCSEGWNVVELFEVRIKRTFLKKVQLRINVVGATRRGESSTAYFHPS